MDTLLAIASRRDERRTLPDALGRELELQLLDAGRLSGSSRNAQPWAFVVPTSRLRIETLAQAVFVPDNVLDAGFVVGILVHGRGPVLFDAGRAAQSMLLAAWAEGLSSCPNGISDPALAGEALDANDGETPVIALSFGLPARPRDVHQRSVAEWSDSANRKSIDEVVRWLP